MITVYGAAPSGSCWKFAAILRLTAAGSTVADLALFAYMHVAGEGELDLGSFPAIQAWIGRTAALSGIERVSPTET